MILSNELLHYKNDVLTKWVATTIKSISRKEDYLEDIIAKNPEVLGFDAVSDGIYGPFIVMQQILFSINQGRTVIPDIILLSASGHVIIIEVKLYGNPELKDRRVISQIIDYASAFSQKTKEEIAEILCKNEDWYEFVGKVFNEINDIEVLADSFINKLKNGDINLIIACDKLPPGVKELIEGICVQSALDFKMDVIEVTPYVKDEECKEILFVPKPRIRTSIVGRTVININLDNDIKKSLSIDVKTTSLDEIEENVEEIKKGKEERFWTSKELDEIYLENGNDILRKLYQFSIYESYENRIDSKGKRIKPDFGFYVSGKILDTDDIRTIQLFGYKSGNNSIRIYFNMISTILQNEVIEEFRKRINEITCMDCTDIKEFNIPIEIIEEKWEEFKEIILWIKDKI